MTHSPDNPAATHPQTAPGVFATKHWSLVLAAADEKSPRASTLWSHFAALAGIHFMFTCVEKVTAPPMLKI